MRDGKVAFKPDDLPVAVEHEVGPTFAQPLDVAERLRVFQNVQALPSAFRIVALQVGGLNGGERIGDLGRRRRAVRRCPN